MAQTLFSTPLCDNHDSGPKHWALEELGTVIISRNPNMPPCAFCGCPTEAVFDLPFQVKSRMSEAGK